MLLPLNATRAAITDFNTWTKVVDNVTPDLNASLDSASQITLSAANNAIPSAYDLAYQSVNGNTVAGSTAGFYFSPAASFQVAVDFAVTFGGTPTGGLAFGFGIGEDGSGVDSAGVVLFTEDGSAGGDMSSFPFVIPSYFIAGRQNDVTQTPTLISLSSQLSGSLFVSYDALTGNITGGVGAASASSPSSTGSLSGFQNGWDNQPLFPAIFIRSDATGGQAWTSGTANAAFSNFRVISGTPIAVPEPGTIGLLAWFAVAVPCVRRRMRSARGRTPC